MNHVKALGAAAVAAVALTALFGASTASATEFCVRPFTPCVISSMYKPGTELEWKVINHIVIQTSAGTITCKEGRKVAEQLNTGGSGLAIVFTRIRLNTLSNCTVGTTSCSVKETSLGEAEYSSGAAEGEVSETASFTEQLPLGWHAECGLLINCTFSSSSATFSGNDNKGEPTEEAKEVSLVSEGELCPNTAMLLTGGYILVKPVPLFIV